MFEVYELEPASREHKARRTLAARWRGDSTDDYVRASEFAESLTKKHGTTHAVLWNGREQARFVWKRGVRRLELRANPGRRFSVVETAGFTIVRSHGTYDDPRRAYRSLRQAASKTTRDVYLVDADTLRVLAVAETLHDPRRGPRVAVRSAYRS